MIWVRINAVDFVVDGKVGILYRLRFLYILITYKRGEYG